MGSIALLGTGSPAYDTDAWAYFIRAGITDFTERRAVNTFVTNCKSNTNIWNALQGGFVYLVSPTSYGASLHNLLSSSFQASAGTNPLYSTNGWNFNGSTQYLKTGLIPLSVMTANQGFILFDVSAYTAANTVAIGASDAGGNTQWQCGVQTAGGNTTFNAYNTATAISAANANTSGTYVFGVLSSTSRYVRRNGVSITTSGAAIGGTLPNLEMYIGARNLAGAASNFSAFTARTIINGLGALSTSDADLLVSYVNTYNSTVISGGR